MGYLPIDLEADINRKYPGLFAEIKRSEPKTIESAFSAAGAWMRNKNLQFTDQLCDDAYIASVLYFWMQHRMIYTIDKTLCAELAKQAKTIQDDDAVPSALLMNLPYACIAVDAVPIHVSGIASNTGDLMVDFYRTGRFLLWVSPAGDFDSKHSALHALWESEDGKLHSHLLPVVGDTFGDCIDALQSYLSYEGTENVERMNAAAEALPMYFAAQIVLYLQSKNADLQTRPKKNRSKKTSIKQNTTVRPPKVIDAGVRIGATLRKAYAAYDSANVSRSGTGAGMKKRPHSRRGHWHHYWYGPRNGERTLGLLWVEPTFINGGDKDTTVVVPIVGGDKND